MVLIDKTTRVLVQGITGHHGSIHTKMMIEYGTAIVAGVTPGKGGQTVEGIPVYNTVKEAVKKHKPTWSVCFVPPDHAREAVFEALNNGLNVIIVTENVPVHDTIAFLHQAAQKKRIVLGPNCPGMVVPGQCKIGIIPGYLCRPGRAGVLSRSGTLMYEIVRLLTQSGIGQSTIIGLGGDPITGMNFIDALAVLEKDKNTTSIVLIGEIGGELEEQAAEYIKKKITKPVVAFIAGKTAPAGKRMGHAGAIISGSTGTAQAKIEALKKARVRVAETMAEIAQHLKSITG